PARPRRPHGARALPQRIGLEAPRAGSARGGAGRAVRPRKVDERLTRRLESAAVRFQFGTDRDSAGFAFAKRASSGAESWLTRLSRDPSPALLPATGGPGRPLRRPSGLPSC